MLPAAFFSYSCHQSDPQRTPSALAAAEVLLVLAVAEVLLLRVLAPRFESSPPPKFFFSESSSPPKFFFSESSPPASSPSPRRSRAASSPRHRRSSSPPSPRRSRAASSQSPRRRASLGCEEGKDGEQKRHLNHIFYVRPNMFRFQSVKENRIDD